MNNHIIYKPFNNFIEDNLIFNNLIIIKKRQLLVSIPLSISGNDVSHFIKNAGFFAFLCKNFPKMFCVGAGAIIICPIFISIFFTKIVSGSFYKNVFSIFHKIFTFKILCLLTRWGSNPHMTLINSQPRKAISLRVIKIRLDLLFTSI